MRWCCSTLAVCFSGGGGWITRVISREPSSACKYSTITNTFAVFFVYCTIPVTITCPVALCTVYEKVKYKLLSISHGCVAAGMRSTASKWLGTSVRPSFRSGIASVTSYPNHKIVSSRSLWFTFLGRLFDTVFVYIFYYTALSRNQSMYSYVSVAD